ncbi:hypothetical protein BDZ85DRAFT_265016 [Elsinoe ampelina]|uniref:Uncharacterized protein n=1 Tax=Elsinoe ampelina TaxID=302913 RepID=A0A6A6G9W4_9PEZI|nr:hypothetical protein BDZ85DRAFT_265016 [Elsinoe ampelina]
MSSIFGGSIRSHHSHHSSHSRSKHSPSRVYIRPSASRSAPSIFSSASGSRGLFGSSSKHYSSSSAYGRRPRDGYISYLVHKLKRLIKDLWRYAQRHPVKTFFAVIVPLISAGGAVSALLRTWGVSVPLLAAFNGAGSRGGGGYYGSSGYDDYGSRSGGSDMMGTVGQALKIAQAFM